MDGSSLRRRTLTVTWNSALGTSPTTSAFRMRCFVLPASRTRFCPEFMMEISFLFSMPRIFSLFADHRKPPLRALSASFQPIANGCYLHISRVPRQSHGRVARFAYFSVDLFLGN